jgi:hypothetical protein
MTVSELNTINNFTIGSLVAFQYPDREHGGFKTVEGIVETVAANKAGKAYVRLTNDGQYRSYTASKIRFN